MSAARQRTASKQTPHRARSPAPQQAGSKEVNQTLTSAFRQLDKAVKALMRAAVDRKEQTVKEAAQAKEQTVESAEE